MEKVWVGEAGESRVWRWESQGVRRWVSWERGCIEVNYG
jgi:hypothetical protein